MNIDLISPARTIYEPEYKPLDAAALMTIKPMYSLRPNKSCDSAPLCHYLYRYYYKVSYCLTGDALMLKFTGDEGDVYGFPPYCPEADVPYYFKRQETYFNRELHVPLVIHGADREFVDLLRKTDTLRDYLVAEAADSRDYLYDAEALRTLAGRKYSKKRNHIHRFSALYDGSWEYRRLSPQDADEAMSFLKSWMYRKEAGGGGTGIDEAGAEFDAVLELEAEYLGLKDILSNPDMYSIFRIGGVFIDGKLEAFSIGDYNPSEKMAVVSVEKANESIPGLYQIINQQFLIHEFPDALLVNREDDVGIEGLRQAKLSYYPTGFERKYTLKQQCT